MVAVSGGVDSGVVAGICVRALGPEHVLCLRLPERDAASESSDIGLELANSLGARTVEEPITDALEALGCYRRRDEAIRRVFPEYEPGWRHKLVRSRPTGGMIVFSLVVERPDGTEEQRRMPPDAYRELLAASNMKQRTRKLLEYTWADRLSYAVAGTPEPARVRPGVLRQGRRRARGREADRPPLQGPGLRARARAGPPGVGRLPLPDHRHVQPARRPRRSSTSATRTSGWTCCCGATTKGVAPAELAPRVGLEANEVEAAYREIERRRVATEYLHAPAVLVEPAD